MTEEQPKVTGPLAAKVARLGVLGEVQTLQMNSSGKRDEPFYTSGRHNYGRWIERGYSSAATIVRDMRPEEGETARDYLARLLARLEASQQDYRGDTDDEDGGGAGAVGDAILVAERFARVYRDT